jgi:hypothetical protein
MFFPTRSREIMGVLMAPMTGVARKISMAIIQPADRYERNWFFLTMFTIPAIFGNKPFFHGSI